MHMRLPLCHSIAHLQGDIYKDEACFKVSANTTWAWSKK